MRDHRIAESGTGQQGRAIHEPFEVVGDGLGADGLLDIARQEPADLGSDQPPGRLPALRAAGLVFRTEACSEVTAPNGLTFREIHLPAHDGVVEPGEMVTLALGAANRDPAVFDDPEKVVIDRDPNGETDAGQRAASNTASKR